jgi:hypothetical protein
MKHVHCSQRMVLPAWETAASGHFPGREVAAQVLTGCCIGSPSAPAERQR